MSDEYKYPHSIKSLEVVMSNAKVEQLKQEMSADHSASEKKPVDQNVIDRALDPNKSHAQKLLEGKVIDAIRSVYDPEIPINIYDLGLIYEIKVHDDSRVSVKMTLTAPGCPVAGSLPAEVEKKIEAVPEVTSASVELVWEPPWDKSRMSEAAMLELGFL